MRHFLLLTAFIVSACGQAGAQPETKLQLNPAAHPLIKQAENAAQTKEVKSNWSVDKSQSHIQFTASQNGDDFTGVFEDYTALINFVPSDLEHAHVKVSIMLGTVDTGDSERDEALPGKDWFYIRNFPKAVFETISFTHLGKDKYEAKAILTMKGVSQNMTLPFSLQLSEDIATMHAKIILNRRVYNLGDGMWKSKEWVGHDVAVDIVLRALKKE